MQYCEKINKKIYYFRLIQYIYIYTIMQEGQRTSVKDIDQAIVSSGKNLKIKF